MSSDGLWNEWVEPFDLFISYARVDNAGEHQMVSALVDTIAADFARFSPSVPLKVFFDKKAILDGQYWADVLRKGLRQSKVMLAVLSEAYFQSEWCRKEWEEYVLVEQARTYSGEALMPIFIVAPKELSRLIPESARDWWNDVTARNAVVEIHPFWPRGRAALQEQLVVQRMQALEANIRTRVEHGRVLARVPRDIRGRNPNFVGRKAELARLRDALSRFEMAGICAVNGVGGIGKSAVAREYAYLYRREYLGGQFEIDLSRAHSVEAVENEIVRLARDYLGADIPPALPHAEQVARARAAFQRLPPGQVALLILDNLEEADAGNLGRIDFPSAEKVHRLITTRADPRGLGRLETIALDVLAPDEALDLLWRYRAFERTPDDPEYLRARAGTYPLTDLDAAAAEPEWKAALAVVQRLGRHALAVTLVGAYLGSYPDMTNTRFAQDLGRYGIGLALDAAGQDEKVRNLVQHPETLIGPLFERSVARLHPLALRTLEYAALLPADVVPLHWLKELVRDDAAMARYLRPEPFQPPPWEEALRTLAGLQYLVGGPYARMHRVVQEVVRRRMTEGARREREAKVSAWVEQLTATKAGDASNYADLAELSAVEQFIRSRWSKPSGQVGRAAMWLVWPLQQLGRLGTAKEMARFAHRVLTEVAADDPHSAAKQRDLSVSLERLGDVGLAGGDLQAARRHFEESLRLFQQLARDAPPLDREAAQPVGVAEQAGRREPGRRGPAGRPPPLRGRPGHQPAAGPRRPPLGREAARPLGFTLEDCRSAGDAR